MLLHKQYTKAKKKSKISGLTSGVTIEAAGEGCEVSFGEVSFCEAGGVGGREFWSSDLGRFLWGPGLVLCLSGLFTLVEVVVVTIAFVDAVFPPLTLLLLVL